MSQFISCYNCGAINEVNSLSDKYELIVRDIVCGKMASKNAAGIDVIGEDGKTTYQVKYATANNKGIWRWFGAVGSVNPDFCVFFGVDSRNTDFMFLLNYEVVKIKSIIRTLGHRGVMGEWVVSASTNMNNWIWDYKTSIGNFMKRVDYLNGVRQLYIDFSDGG